MWMKHFSCRQCWRFQSWRCRWWCSSGDWSWGWVAFGTATAFCTWVVQLQMRGAFFGLSIVASSSTIGFEWYSWKETMINYVLCASCLEFMYFWWVCIWRRKIQHKYRCSIGFLKNTSAKKDITNRTEKIVLYPAWIQMCIRVYWLFHNEFWTEFIYFWTMCNVDVTPSICD